MGATAQLQHPHLRHRPSNMDDAGWTFVEEAVALLHEAKRDAGMLGTVHLSTFYGVQELLANQYPLDNKFGPSRTAWNENLLAIYHDRYPSLWRRLTRLLGHAK